MQRIKVNENVIQGIFIPVGMWIFPIRNAVLFFVDGTTLDKFYGIKHRLLLFEPEICENLPISCQMEFV